MVSNISQVLITYKKELDAYEFPDEYKERFQNLLTLYDKQIGCFEEKPKTPKRITYAHKNPTLDWSKSPNYTEKAKAYLTECMPDLGSFFFNKIEQDNLQQLFSLLPPKENTYSLIPGGLFAYSLYQLARTGKLATAKIFKRKDMAKVKKLFAIIITKKPCVIYNVL